METITKLNWCFSKFDVYEIFHLKTYRTNRDELVGMIHHCNEEIEEHDDVDY